MIKAQAVALHEVVNIKILGDRQWSLHIDYHYINMHLHLKLHIAERP